VHNISLVAISRVAFLVSGKLAVEMEMMEREDRRMAQ